MPLPARPGEGRHAPEPEGRLPQGRPRGKHIAGLRRARHRRGLIGTPETTHSEDRRNVAEAATLMAAVAARLTLRCTLASAGTMATAMNVDVDTLQPGATSPGEGRPCTRAEGRAPKVVLAEKRTPASAGAAQAGTTSHARNLALRSMAQCSGGGDVPQAVALTLTWTGVGWDDGDDEEPRRRHPSAVRTRPLVEGRLCRRLPWTLVTSSDTVLALCQPRLWPAGFAASVRGMESPAILISGIKPRIYFDRFWRGKTSVSA
jgi:hypothetical protein